MSNPIATVSNGHSRDSSYVRDMRPLLEITGLDPELGFEPLPSSDARCGDGAGTLAHLFFSDDDFDIARAKKICSTCRLQASCLAGALERNEAYGVWGGQLLIDGEPVRFTRRRGRPAADRIEFVDDEVPIPAHLVA